MAIGFDLAILYRGPLDSCNYDCAYCPFGKKTNTREELDADEADLRKFGHWIKDNADRTYGILFTPWGEALVREYYQHEFVRLSRLPHVKKVAAQTNLSYPLDWLAEADKSAAALWCSFHPTETTRGAFLSQCRKLDSLGVRYSVGVVGLREHLPEIEALRRELPPHIYLWVNAYKRVPDYHTSSEQEWLASIDPLFTFNNRHHPSKGRPCNTGHHAITVDGKGDMRRCHFVPEVLGNIYHDDVNKLLKPRSCSNATCHCHIGYVHMPELGLQGVFAEGVLERIPTPHKHAGNQKQPS